MGDILFLAHRVPYPPDRGDKIRSFHMLRHLAAHRRIHLAAFADDPRDVDRPELAAYAASRVVVRRSKSQIVAGVQALAAARPLPEAIIRLMRALPPVDGMDALRTLTSALGHYDPDAHDNSLQASYRKAVRLTGQIASLGQGVAQGGRTHPGPNQPKSGMDPGERRGKWLPMATSGASRLVAASSSGSGPA